MRRRGKGQWLLVKSADEFADRRRNRLDLRRDKDPAAVTREVARP